MGSKCVYVHLDANGLPFYVGLGSLFRSKARWERYRNLPREEQLKQTATRAAQLRAGLIKKEA